MPGSLAGRVVWRGVCNEVLRDHLSPGLETRRDDFGKSSHPVCLCLRVNGADMVAPALSLCLSPSWEGQTR